MQWSTDILRWDPRSAERACKVLSILLLPPILVL